MLIVEFHQPIAARVLEEAQKRGALPYPVGAESKYEIPPLFYRLSGTFRQANPQSEHCAIRINPNRSGEETVLRILREYCQYLMLDSTVKLNSVLNGPLAPLGRGLG